SDGTYRLFTESLKDEHGLCDGELFGNQPTAAACSGVLIDEDLVLTAGHCVDAHTPCDAYAYVFNYHLDDATRPTHLADIRDEYVYSCARVVSQGSPLGSDYTPDFALVQLDRPVEGAHAPASIRPATPLSERESLAMIGFGSGLPAKIDSGGTVADPRADRLDFFVANVDAFQGHSGSATFDSENRLAGILINVDAFQGHSGSATFDSENRLAGILIGGRTPDYVTLDDESCERVAVYEDSQAAEVVHNIAPIVAALCDDGWDAQELCGPEACEGQPCGVTLPPSGGARPVPGDTTGCSASGGTTAFTSGWLGLLLFAVARRFRRRAA
ncbi:MAG: trypsin-like peptidase domain-containing protein, partial [Deltaproteobacteria bacterium]|nr:trypsin-like peptidase domain-containing protein [Deltaproteobacteria bacterium]